MKEQQKVGSVHLRVSDLDRVRFMKLCERHNMSGSVSWHHLDYFGCEYIENWTDFNFEWRKCWITTNAPDSESKLITLDELEKLIKS